MAPAPNRVLHLIHSPERRGAEIFAAQLACCMEEGGLFENGLCSLYDGGDATLPVRGLPVFKLEGRAGLLDKTIGLDFGAFPRLYSLLRQYHPDIILAHGSSTLQYAAAAGAFYRRGTIVYRNIGTASVWANSAARVTFNKLLLKGIDAVVSVSQYTREDFIRLYRLPPERVTFIPNAVDTSQFDSCTLGLARPEVRRELGLSQADMVFITVGSLSPEKGHGVLLQLIADLKGMGFEDHLVLVGDGALRRELERQARQLDITDQLHFLGARTDVPRLLTAADLFILPSNTEGMPACLIEAGLAGLASVTFDVGGAAEVVQHGVTGLVVPPEDFQKLLQAVVALRQDPQCRAAMGAAARQRCHDLYAIRKIASDYERLFLRLLSAPVRKRNAQS